MKKELILTAGSKSYFVSIENNKVKLTLICLGKSYNLGYFETKQLALKYASNHSY